jgi:ribosomal protein S20
MLSHYTRTEAEARAKYNYALQAYNNALADEIWWTDLMPTLKEENKKYGSLMRTWMHDFNEKIPEGASSDAISEFGRARGRANNKKTSLHKRKPRKRKNRTYKNW